MKRFFILAVVLAVVIIAFVAQRRGNEPADGGNGSPAAQAETFNTNTYTNPTSKFYAELANYLIAATR